MSQFNLAISESWPGFAWGLRDAIQRGDAEGAEIGAEFNATEELRDGMGGKPGRMPPRMGAAQRAPGLKGYATVLRRRINELRRGFRREHRERGVHTRAMPRRLPRIKAARCRVSGVGISLSMRASASSSFRLER